MNKALTVLAGLISAMVVFMIMERISAINHPLPEGIDLKNREQMIEYARTAPASSLFIVLLGYIIGSFVAGMVIKKASKSDNRRPVYIVSGIFIAFAILNFVSIPHPAWFIFATLAVYYPMMLIGFNLVKVKKSGE